MRRALAAVAWVIAGSASGCTCDVPLGGSCEKDYNCAGDTVCREGVCALPAARKQELLDQSGVGPAPAEQPAIGGDQVRVRTTQGDDLIFAACGAGERLISGGCNGGSDGDDSDHIRSWPGDFAANDTIGARWYCSGEGRLTAYALCQDAIAAPAAPTVDAAGHSRPGPDL